MKRTITVALSAFTLTALVGCGCMRPGCGPAAGPPAVYQDATDCAGGDCGDCSGCAGRNCDDCGRTGCNLRRAIPDLMSMVKASFRNTYGQMGCCGFPFFWGWGCGEHYWGDWCSDPHSKCETCDNYGNWTGPRSSWYGPQPRYIEEAAPEKKSNDAAPDKPAEPMPMPEIEPTPEPTPMPTALRYRTSRRPVRPASRYGFPLRR